MDGLFTVQADGLRSVVGCCLTEAIKLDDSSCSIMACDTREMGSPRTVMWPSCSVTCIFHNPT